MYTRIRRLLPTSSTRRLAKRASLLVILGFAYLARPYLHPSHCEIVGYLETLSHSAAIMAKANKPVPIAVSSTGNTSFKTSAKMIDCILPPITLWLNPAKLGN